MRLSTRIQLSITVLLICLLIIANTAIYVLFKCTIIESEQQRLLNTANTILKELNTNSESSTEQVLRAYLINNGMIKVVGSDHHPVHEFVTDKRYRSIVTSFKDDQYEQVLSFKQSQFAVVSIPMINSEGEVMNLQIVENIDSLMENVTDLKWVLVFTSIVVITLLFIASWILGNIISRPIQRLIYTMKTIEEKESYEQIEISGKNNDELNELAATFNRMIAKLENSYMKQEQFVSDASHELKTPLTVISSYMKLLRRWGTTRADVMEEAMTAIESESSRMKYLTEQLLQLAVSEELIENDRERMNIVPVVHKTIERLQMTDAQEIHFSPDSRSLYADVHEQSFIQLLVILLDNARKYSNDAIHVALEEENNWIKLSVEDRGIGIPEDAQPYVFDRLYRVDQVRSRKTGGAGLGLSIAKRISEQHGGSISMKSVEGAGSVFTVILPKSEA
ncbi:sensor histidine kinase [Domibacillus epiphyticus]|uniref:histidine kinase n=1 Tax=Domibacillus epiphyticus TaxID=1714355 RepID=A0A1V2ABJ8_9BACI|nr:HAMP domain-containing sensor histidine kinase [Domibacillus epiphyticus]OMP68373.1 hypothetical protein BTO28_01765 [Domibacillus epiphyticus]